MKCELAMDCTPEANPECDCPYEHWHVNDVCLHVHLEEDGSTHCILDAGDWDQEVTSADHADLASARAFAFEWARGFVG